MRFAHTALAVFLIASAAPFASSQQVIGDMTASDASVKGSVELASTGARLLSGSSVTAGGSSASVRLARGGELRICPHTGVAITTSQSGKDLQIALNTGAVETHYQLKTSADSILTPDFRILFPGPGTFHFAISADPRGNTCVRSLPGNGSSLVVTEVLGDGVYQVQPHDQVYFRNGRIANADAFVPPDCGCGTPPAPVMRADTEKPEIPTRTVPTEPAGGAAASSTTSQPATPTPQAASPSPNVRRQTATGPAFVTQVQPAAPKPQAPQSNAPKIDVGSVPTDSPQALIAAYGNPVAQPPAPKPATPVPPAPDVTSTNLQLEAPFVFSAESAVPPQPMTLSLQSMAPLNLSESAILPTPVAPELKERRAAAPNSDQPKKKGVFGKIGGFFAAIFGSGKKSQ